MTTKKIKCKCGRLNATAWIGGENVCSRCFIRKKDNPKEDGEVMKLHVRTFKRAKKMKELKPSEAYKLYDWDYRRKLKNEL